LTLSFSLPGKQAIGVRAYEILDGLDRKFYTPTNVSLEDFKFKNLVTRLGETSNLEFDPEEFAIVYIHPDSHVQVTIKDDKTF
jgi:hypothetical protein